MRHTDDESTFPADRNCVQLHWTVRGTAGLRVESTSSLHTHTATAGNLTAGLAITGKVRLSLVPEALRLWSASYRHVCNAYMYKRTMTTHDYP